MDDIEQLAMVKEQWQSSGSNGARIYALRSGQLWAVQNHDEHRINPGELLMNLRRRTRVDGLLPNGIRLLVLTHGEELMVDRLNLIANDVSLIRAKLG